MAKRKSRQSIVYRPKGKGKRKGRARARNDEEENKPSCKTWDKMHLFGAFSMDDKNDDNLKYRFRRGDIATILPSSKAPGESIEPHEYWVGKIIEIRADQGSVDSEQIWTKVQWLYSAEEAKDLIPSLDTSLFGKFERIWSDHWDFVYPHAFNEVISLTRLFTFPRTSPTTILQQSLPRTPKQRGRRNQLSRSREASLLSSSSTPTTITTTTTDRGSSSSTTMTTVASTGDESISAVAPTMQDLMAQRFIGPEMFYWRYTLSVEERILGPEPRSPSNCICSNPYRPDDVSLRSGVMIYCPRQGCRTGYHLGCLEDVNCVWVDDEGDKRKYGGKTSGRKRVRGKGKKKVNQTDIDIDVEGTQDEDDDDERWLSKRAIRQISTSPDSNDTYVDLLSLLDSQPSKNKTQTQKKKKKKGDGGGLVTSLLERVYDRQLEQYYLYSQSESSSSQPRQKRRTKKLTSNSLLATLFILPPPFPSPPSPLLSKQKQRQRQQQCELHLLLALACQPLIRGGGCFPWLGPTGNVNAVLCARGFVWEVVKRIGELDLAVCGSTSLRERGRGVRGRGKSSLVVGEDEFDEEEEEQEWRDREGFSRVRECVETVLDGYREKFFSLSTMDDSNSNSNNKTTGGRSENNDGGSTTRLMKDLVLPPDGSIEDAIVIKKGLLFFDYIHRSRRRRSGSCRDSSTSTEEEEEEEEEDGDVDIEGVSDGDGIGVGDVMRMKDEPRSDVEIVEETEQEEEGVRDDDDDDDDDAYTSAVEVDNILLSSPRKRKRLTTTMRRRGNYYQMRKKFKTGGVGLGCGEGDDSDDVDDDKEEEEEEEVDVDENEDEEEEEDSEDEMLLNADWACPGCGGSI